MDNDRYLQNALFGEESYDVSEIKQCDKCHRYLSYEGGFDKDPTTKDGYDHRCKECKAEEARLRKHRKSIELEYNKTLRVGG